MGLLIEGKWVDRWYDTGETKGRFVRKPRTFRDQVGAADGRFPAQPGRYHLYVSLACPWAHRTLIYRAILGLEEAISVSVVHPHMGEEGWVFGDYPGATSDAIHGVTRLHEIYTRAQSDYTGRVTVPILWDTETHTIVNNESSEIIRQLDGAFRPWAQPKSELPQTFYPTDLRAEIDATNALVYDRINDGVYKAGFATRQEAYEEAVTALFEALDQLEERLARQRYLAGAVLTEADWRLLTTLLRFDAVYHGHFKCNRRRIVDYPHLWAYTRELYQVPGVAETVNFAHIQQHYYTSHTSINPTRIVPVGPELDFLVPHGREQIASPTQTRA